MWPLSTAGAHYSWDLSTESFTGAALSTRRADPSRGSGSSARRPCPWCGCRPPAPAARSAGATAPRTFGILGPPRASCAWARSASKPHQCLGLAHVQARARPPFGPALRRPGCRPARGHGPPTGDHPRPAPAPPRGRVSSRIVLATWLRLLPIASASASWVWRELVGQPAVGMGLLQRRKVGALQVLDQRQLERLLVGELAHDDRHLVLAGPLRRPPAPLAGDDLVARCSAAGRADQQRLQDAALADRLRQRLQLGLVEPAARLQGRRAQELDRHALRAGGRSSRRVGLGAVRRAAPTGPCRARAGGCALPPALTRRPAAARGAASRRRDGRRPGRPRS